jgi:hypothetical protein
VHHPAKGFLTLEVTEQYAGALDELETAVRKQAVARARLLFENPAHPSLKAHQIKPDKYYWEAYVNRGDRLIYIPEGSHLVLVDVVPHDRISAYGKRRKPLQTPRSAPSPAKKKR